MGSVSFAADRPESPAATTTPAFIGIAKVKEISGFSKATILRWMEKGKFPRPVIHQATCVRWDYSEVMAWRQKQFKKRDDRLKQRGRGSAA